MAHLNQKKIQQGHSTLPDPSQWEGDTPHTSGASNLAPSRRLAPFHKILNTPLRVEAVLKLSQSLTHTSKFVNKKSYEFWHFAHSDNVQCRCWCCCVNRKWLSTSVVCSVNALAFMLHCETWLIGYHIQEVFKMQTRPGCIAIELSMAEVFGTKTLFWALPVITAACRWYQSTCKVFINIDIFIGIESETVQQLCAK